MTTLTQCGPLFDAIELHNKRIGKESLEEFVRIFSSSKQRSIIVECVKSCKFQKQHGRRLFAGLLPIVQHIIDSEWYVPRSALANEDNDENDASRRYSDISQVEVTPDADSTAALLFLKYTAVLAKSYIHNLVSRRSDKRDSSLKREFEIIEEVFSIVELLHDTLFELHSCGATGVSVQKSISNCCEAYWEGGFIDREVIATSLIPLLVLRSLDGNATKADIKRLWNVREMLSLLDFSETSIAYIRSLLLRTVSSPMYIKCADGRRMISHLFQLDTSLVQDLHNAIRAQIPMAKGSSLDAYGEIYFRAWKESTSDPVHQKINTSDINLDNTDSDEDGDDQNEVGDIQNAIEDNVLQDLMYSSLHVASPHMAKAIRTVLEPFHCQKKSRDVDQMLYKMYTPILWRSLSAANPFVRIHGSSILATTFPLRDPRAGKLHLKDIYNKSVKALMMMMNDDDPKVRVAGCDATIRILGAFWDVLSSKDIRSLLNEIVMRHATDAASSAVRAYAVHGITLLMDAKSAHGVLRSILPLLGNLLHDKVERVRLAFCNLLLKIKKIKNFKYYHVVGREHILARLAAEGENEKNVKGPVASALTKLLSNSYLPIGAKGSEQIRRTLLFLSEDPKAARVFYSNITTHSDVTVVSKLIGLLLKTLKIAVDRHIEEKQNESTMSDSERYSKNQESDALIASNTKLMSGIAQALQILLSSIGPLLEEPENENCLDFVQNSIKGTTIINLCTHFETLLDANQNRRVKKGQDNDCHQICASLLRCASHITSTLDRQEVYSQLAKRIKSFLAHGGIERVTILSYLAVFCAWDMQDMVFSSLSKSISSIFDDEKDDEIGKNMESSHPVNSQQRRKRKKSDMDAIDENSIIPRLPGNLAIQVVGQILSGRDPSSVLIRDSLVASEKASSQISCALEKAFPCVEMAINGMVIPNIPACNNELLLLAIECFGRLAVHREAFSSDILNTNQQLVTLLEWISDRAIPGVLIRANNRTSCSPFRDLNLSRISVGGDVEESPAPLSPIGIAPPRRRSNLGLTPSKVDSSFCYMENHGDQEYRLGSKGTINILSLVVSLVKSSATIFSDWLLLGGNSVDRIVPKIVQWKCIFDAKDAYIDARVELFPSYCKMGVLLAMQCSNFELLREVMIIADTFEQENEVDICITNVITCLGSDKASKGSNLIALLETCLSLFKAKVLERDFANEEDPPTLNDFVSSQGPAMKNLLGMLLSKHLFMTAFAKTLLKEMVSPMSKKWNLSSSEYEKLLSLVCRDYQRRKNMTLVDCKDMSKESFHEIVGAMEMDAF